MILSNFRAFVILQQHEIISGGFSVAWIDLSSVAEKTGCLKWT